MWRARSRSCIATMLVLITVSTPGSPSGAPFGPSFPPAQPRAVPAATLAEGTLRFDGHATTGDFVGTTSRVAGAVLASPDYVSLRGWVEAPVAALRTGNGLRDRDLRKVMDVDRYPTMRYDLTGSTLQSASSPDSASLVLHGTLRLHGVARAVDVPVTVVRSGDGARVVGTFPVDVTDHGVGGLRKMGGLLRMRERIEVHLALRFVVGG
jgi:polyisoprenoid-binding protein YceI